MSKEKTIKSFKAFDREMKCLCFQYEVGKEYEENNIKVCERGFHACENPFDVLDYYPLVDERGMPSRFAEVEQSGDIDRDENKTCSSKIRIKAELTIGQFVKACVEWIKDATSYKTKVSGNCAQIGSSGNCAQIGSSGNYAKIGSSGDSAKIGSSGDSAKIGSSGYYAQIGSSGNYAKIGSSGYYAQIGSSGNCAKINSEGMYSVVCCAGHGSMAKAKVGSWITLSEWEYSEEERRYIPICVKTEKVDGERIKGDTFYKLVGGEFVEVCR